VVGQKKSRMAVLLGITFSFWSCWFGVEGHEMVRAGGICREKRTRANISLMVGEVFEQNSA